MKHLVSVCAVALLLSAACGLDEPRNRLVVGSLVPRTGPNANADWIMAAQLAADEMNEALDRTPNPRRLAIRWESRDSASTPALMRHYARELVGRGAKILTGEASDTAYGNIENYVAGNPLGAAFICASCTSPDINNPVYGNRDVLIEAAFRDPGQWLYRTAPLSRTHDTILARKMASLGDRGDTNGDGLVKVVVLCTTDTSCISTQTSSDVAAHRRATLDTLTASLHGAACSNACSRVRPGNHDDECRAACEAAPGCSFDATVRTCASDRVVFEYLLVDQYTAADSPEWAALMARVFDGKTDRDSFQLAAGTTTASPEAPGAVFAETSSSDPAGCRGPDFVWNKALPVPSLSLVRAYSTGGYPVSHPTTKFMNQDGFHRNFIRLALGDTGNGLEGVALQPWDRSPAGEHFVRALRERTGNIPTSYDAQYYDAVALAMLATLKAALAAEDPQAVTGADVRAALDTLNDPAGTSVGVGPSEFARAITLLQKGEAINYTGASGSCDFSAPSATGSGGDVGPGEATYWRIENGEFSYKEIYDCRQTATNCPMTPLGD